MLHRHVGCMPIYTYTHTHTHFLPILEIYCRQNLFLYVHGVQPQKALSSAPLSLLYYRPNS